MFGLSAQDKTDNFIFYNTSIECSSLPHPFQPSCIDTLLPKKPPIADNAIANLTAKLYVPCMNPPQPILLDALETEVFLGDPFDWDYLARIPITKSPTIFANSVVSDSNQSNTNSVVTFLLMVSEFIWNSMKQTMLLYPFSLSLSPCYQLMHTDSCRLDKGSRQWRNVPASAWSA